MSNTNETAVELDDFYAFTEIVELRVSPDGNTIAFVAHEFDPVAEKRRRSVFTVPADGSEPPHRLSRASDARSPRWSPDGSKLAVLATRETDVGHCVTRSKHDRAGSKEQDGETTDEEPPRQQVWVFDLSRGGDARRITNREEGVRDFDWGPNGERVVIESRDPTEEQAEYLHSRRKEGGPIVIDRLQHKYMGQGWLDDVEAYLFVVDVGTREERRLDDAWGSGAQEPEYGLQPRWSPRGDRIAFLSNRTENPDDSLAMDLYTISPDGTALERLTDSEVTAHGARWNRSGEVLGFVGGDPTNWYVPSEVYVASPTARTYRSVSGDLDRPVSPYTSRIGWQDADTMIVPIGDEGTTRLARFYADSAPPERLSFGEQRNVDRFDLNGETVGLCLSAPDEWPEVYSLDVEDLSPDSGTARSASFPRQLSDANDDLQTSRRRPAYDRLRFENGSGVDVEALVCYPEGRSSEPLPTIVVVHGGPMTYDPPSFSFDTAYWVSQGYLVLRVDYRGSSSYGRAFSEALRGRWNSREVEDILAGVEHVVERGRTDPDRVFVTGFSQGGVNTAYLVTRSDAFAAAAAEHGIYDFYSAFGTCDLQKWYENDLGLPWENPEAYDAISSLPDVGNVSTPLLVTAGEEDWRCPPSQAEQLYVSVKKRGVPSKLIVYPGEHHNVGEPDRAIHRLDQLTSWFERHDPRE